MADLVSNLDVATGAHLQALGKRILSEANDLKRTPEALAQETSLSLATIEAVIAGRADIDTVRQVMNRMSEVYPVSLADLWIDENDSDNGAWIMSADASKATARIFTRANRTADQTDYYEYRDTAMSRLSPFRPEWITPMRIVDNADPRNPDVAFNNGHLMHQCTFFIGQVNFYWEVDGIRHCSEMNTGDSNYITPFVPHSFTSRDPAAPGLIIAVTYAGQVRAALNEFGHIGAAAAEDMADDLENTIRAFQSRLARHLTAESLSSGDLHDRLVEAGLENGAAAEISSGSRVPLPDELEALARCLHLRAEDLMVTPLATDERVIVKFFRDARHRGFPNDNRPAYRLTELSRSRHQSSLKGFDVAVLNREASSESMFCHGLHEYIYNYGDQPTILFWGDDRRATLAPGDSAYILPMVSHGFLNPAEDGESRLAVIRIPGAMNMSTVNEYSTFPVEGRSRVAGETRKWF